MSPIRSRAPLVPRLVLGAVFASALALVIGGLVGPAEAQDDWGLTRERPGARRGGARRGGARRGGARSGSARRGGAGRGSPRRGSRGPRPAGDEASPAPADDRGDVLIARYLGIVERDPRPSFAFRRLMDLYRERDGNIDRLVEDLTARVVADDDAYAPRMLLGHVQVARNDHEAARAQYLRAAELQPDDAAPRVALAQLERTAGDGAAARRRYDEALERTRERLAREELLREVAEVAMTQEDWDGARGYYEELARGGESSLYLRTEYARALAAARQHERAVAEYDRVIRALRGDNRVLPPILLELSRSQLETGEIDASIEALDRALRLAGRQAGIRAEVYDQMLDAYRRADRLDELAERLRREGAGGFEGSALLGRIEDELGNDDAALEAYRRALRARGQDIDTRVRIIQLLSRSGRLDDVIEEYRGLIRSAPREPRFVIELAQLLVQTDRRDDALRLLRETGRRHARDPVLHQQLAELYTRWGEDALAAAEVERLVQIDPRDPAHLLALGAQRFDANDVEGAVRTWQRIVEVEADRASGHAALAGIFSDHDLLPRAIDQYREAVRLEPEELTYVRGLATTLERNHETEEAERVWRRVLEIAEEDRVARREARERIVGIWQRTRRLSARIRDLEASFRAVPPDPDAGRFLAEAYRRSGPERAGDAERVLTRIVEVDPGDVESLLALERIRRHRGDLAGAIEILGRLRDADPRRAAHYLQQMAEHALALYRDDEAVEYAAEAVRRNPDDATGHRRLGDLYRARQDTARAIRSYRRALELNERLYDVYFELAELHLAASEIDEADALYRRLLQITPDDDLVRRAARASIQIHLGAGTLHELERDLLPLALANPQRPIFRRVAVELYESYAGPLVGAARRGGADAEAARTELARVGSRAIKPLLEALAASDPAQRRVALDILGDLSNPSAAAPLIALAENDLNELGQRMQAMRAAGALAGPDLVPRLTRMAADGDRRLRGLATWALARIGGDDARAALRRLYREGDETVRGYAAIGLGVAGEAEPLASVLPREANEDVLHATAWGLGRAGDQEHVPALVRVLQAGGGASAEVAADALGRVGGDQARRALVEALFTPDAELREAAARGLRGAVATDGDEGATLPAPRPFERVRDYVARLLVVPASREGAAVELGPLAPALEEAASRALTGPVEQILATLALLDDGPRGIGLGPVTAGDASSTTRAQLTALGVALVDELVTASEHVDGAVRVAAVRLLGYVDDPRADAAMTAALSDGPPEVRRAALDALARGRRAPEGALVEQLAAVLGGDREWSMRTRAAEALGRARSDEARAALREALEEDGYAFVREAAARALGHSDDPADVAALDRALSADPEPRVRAAVRETRGASIR